MEKQRKTFFSSDNHFFHANILKYENRPYSTVEEMNEDMIAKHNHVVKPGDIVYFIGDFAMNSDEAAVLSVLKRLNGEKHFVPGNHDKVMRSPRIQAEFHRVYPSSHTEIYVADPTVRGGKQAITLCHFAMRVWNKSHHGAFHLYGHSHGSLPDDPNSRSFDIGVDCWEFYPISYNKVKEVMSKKTWKPIDHHGAD